MTLNSFTILDANQKYNFSQAYMCQIHDGIPGSHNSAQNSTAVNITCSIQAGRGGGGGGGRGSGKGGTIPLPFSLLLRGPGGADFPERLV